MKIITLIIMAVIISAVITRNIGKREKINKALENVKTRYPLVETCLLDYSRKFKFILLFSDDVSESYRRDATDLFYRELEKA